MQVIQPPTLEPVTIEDVAGAARIDDGRFDAIIPGLISAAREVAEQETRLCIMSQVRRAELSSWPSEVIPVADPTAVAVSYWDGAAWAAVAPQVVSFWRAGAGTVVVPAFGQAWPTLGDANGPRVRVDITAGATTPAGVPACIKTYITALVVTLLDNPGLSAAGMAEASPLLSRLLDPVRRWS